MLEWVLLIAAHRAVFSFTSTVSLFGPTARLWLNFVCTVSEYIRVYDGTCIVVEMSARIAEWFTLILGQRESSLCIMLWAIVFLFRCALISLGDTGDSFYVVEEGNFDVFVTKDKTTKRVTVRGAGTSFGELALMYNAPRAATVTVRYGFCSYWYLSRNFTSAVVALVWPRDNHLSQVDEFPLVEGTSNM